jgi:hypothetical protein
MTGPVDVAVINAERVIGLFVSLGHLAILSGHIN